MNGFATDHLGAEFRYSPNFGVRRNNMLPEIILLHYTGMADGEAAESWLCNPKSQVSAHYLVHENGRIIQMVRETDRAWHAGAASWKGNADVNSASIGIEIVNPGHQFGYPDFPVVQIEAVISLCKDIVRRWHIVPEMVLAHSDVAPGRKIDPGEKFPWRILHRAGIGHFVEPAASSSGAVFSEGDAGPEIEQFQSMLSLYGYNVETSGNFTEDTRKFVEAFQRHFRPALIDGKLDSSTFETLRALLAALPHELL